MKYVTRIIVSLLIALMLFAMAPVSAQDDPGRVTDDMLADLAAYVQDSLIRWHIPGAAVAVVQNGEIVYAQGFGVRELGKDDPITPDTVFVMGSMTKSVTDLMLASLVDGGNIEWDTRVVDIWPDFQMADPEVHLKCYPARSVEYACGFGGG